MQTWKDRNKPVFDVEIGHCSATVCHIRNIARWVSQATQQVGTELVWDPKKEELPGDKPANSMLDRSRRKGYELPKVNQAFLNMPEKTQFRAAGTLFFHDQVRARYLEEAAAAPLNHPRLEGDF